MNFIFAFICVIWSISALNTAKVLATGSCDNCPSVICEGDDEIPGQGNTYPKCCPTCPDFFSSESSSETDRGEPDSNLHSQLAGGVPGISCEKNCRKVKCDPRLLVPGKGSKFPKCCDRCIERSDDCASCEPVVNCPNGRIQPGHGSEFPQCCPRCIW